MLSSFAISRRFSLFDRQLRRWMPEQALRFVQFPAIGERIAKLAHGPGDASVLAAKSGARKRQGVAGHFLILLVQAQIVISRRQGQAHLHGDFRLVRQFLANARGGFVQDLPQHGRVSSQSHRGPNALKHILQQLSDLLALGSLSLGFLLVGFSLQAKPVRRPA